MYVCDPSLWPIFFSLKFQTRPIFFRLKILNTGPQYSAKIVFTSKIIQIEFENGLFMFRRCFAVASQQILIWKLSSGVSHSGLRHSSTAPTPPPDWSAAHSTSKSYNILYLESYSRLLFMSKLNIKKIFGHRSSARIRRSKILKKQPAARLGCRTSPAQCDRRLGLKLVVRCTEIKFVFLSGMGQLGPTSDVFLPPCEFRSRSLLSQQQGAKMAHHHRGRTARKPISVGFVDNG